MKNYLKLLLQRICLLAIILTACNINTNAQSLPVVTQQSPEAVSHFKFIDYPVSNSTGIPGISIPFYTVKCGSLTVPISINYHSAGRKTYDLTGAVGLGWELNAGGMIGRTVYGRPDDQSSFKRLAMPRRTDLNQQVSDDFDFLDDAVNPSSGNGDTEFDVFSYYFGSQSGKFVIDQYNSDRVVTMPLKPLKIGGPSSRFPDEIIDENGMKYEFKENETNVANSLITGKLLTKIISADGKDTIYFDYDTRRVIENHSQDDFIVLDNKIPADAAVPYTNNDATSNIGFDHEYYIKRLTKIRFRDGRVEFSLASGSGTYLIGADRVKEVKIYNAANRLIRTIVLQQSFSDYGSGSYELYKLDGLQFIDRGNQVVDKYTFDYKSPPSVAGYFQNARDYFGYFNGQLNTRATPAYTTGSISITPSDGSGYYPNLGHPGTRDRTPYFSDASMIWKITYPTGGTTEFTYEGNVADYGGTINAPGLRIAEIKITDNNGNIKRKTYKYGANEDGKGSFAGGGIISTERARMDRMSFETSIIGPFTNYGSSGRAYEGYRKRVYSPEILPELAEAYNRPIFYQYVTEYEGNATTNIGKTVYEFEGDPDLNETTIPSIPYPPSTFGVYPGAGMSTDLQRYHIKQFNYWSLPRLKSTKVYKNGDNVNPVKTVVNSYLTTYVETLYGLHIVNYIPGGTYTMADNYGQMPVFMWDDYQIVISKCDLSKTVETVNGLVTTTDYTYNSNLLPSEVKITRSDATTAKRTTMKYPFDDPTDPVHAAMITKNMINYVIEQEDFIDAAPIKATKTQYKSWATSVIYPEKLYTKAGSGSYEQRLAYNYNTEGKLISANKVGGTPVSYQYGYQKQYPIVKITNALPTDVFYTSFEETEGNSTADDAHNGHLSRTGGYSKTVTGLTNGSYVLSYWVKSGSTWTLQKSTMTASSGSANITILSSVGQIDDVRLYPVRAQLETYTYDPLIGITSVSDVRDNTTYYNYDNYDRLSYVKDQDGNIKTHYCYNYAGQLTDCAIPTPVGPQIIYARVEISNISYSYTPGSGSEYTYATTGDVDIKLYADAACTSPFTTPTPFEVKLKVKYDNIYDYGYGTTTGTTDTYYTYPVPLNVSSISRGNQPLSSLHSWTDSYDNPLSSTDTFTYTLVNNTGNPYVPETTYTIY